MNEDIIDMSIIDVIPYIQNSPTSKILDTSESILDTFQITPSLSTQMNLIQTATKANDPSINSNEIDQSRVFKILRKQKLIN